MVTPYQLLFHFFNDIPLKEFKSLRVILDNYKYNQCLQTHRPLMKVQRSAKLMTGTIIFNIAFFLIFIVFQLHYYLKLTPDDCMKNSFYVFLTIL